MKIAVCVKRVPDTTTQVKVGPDGKSLNPAGVQYILNPYDEFAVEESLRLKEKAGQGEVVIVSVGPADTQAVIRQALAMGADRGLHLKDEAPERDTFGVAVALAGALQELAPDLVFCGKQAIDDDACSVGGMLAELLDMAYATVVVKLEVQGRTLVCQREVEGGHEVVHLSMPAIVGAQKGLNEPRYASLKGIMAAKKKTIEERPAPAGEVTLPVLKMEPPPPRPAPRIVGKGVEAVPELVKLLREEAKVI